MEPNIENQEAYQSAKKRATARVGFYSHGFIYVAVIALLLMINVSGNSEYLWVKWPMMGWGIGLLLHGLRVFVFSGNKSLTEKMIEKEMKKDGW